MPKHISPYATLATIIIGCMIIASAIVVVNGSNDGDANADRDKADKDKAAAVAEANRRANITAREHEAKTVHAFLDSNAKLIANTIDGFSETWAITDPYWMRQAEVAAAERWGAGQQYSAQALMERAGLYVNATELFRNINEGPDATFSQLNDRIQLWKSTSGFESMEFKLQHGTSSTVYANGLELDLRAAVTVQGRDNKVYLTGDPLWSTGTGYACAQNGTMYDLGPGYNDMSAITPGVYQLSNGDYAGGMLPALMADAPRVQAGIVITSSDGSKLAVRDGDGIRIGNDKYSSLSLTIDTGDFMSDTVDLMPLLDHYGGTIIAIEQSLTKAASSAYSAWRTFAAANA